MKAMKTSNDLKFSASSSDGDNELGVREINWIRGVALKTFELLGYKYLARHMVLETHRRKCSWIARAGRVLFTSQKSILTISLWWWVRMNREQKREIIVHEVCHIVAAMTNLEHPTRPHCGIWRDLMKLVGYEPRAQYGHWYLPEWYIPRSFTVATRTSEHIK